MPDSVFKKVQFVGTSPNSFSEAVANAIGKAAQSEKNPSWFEVVEERGHITNGKIQQYQVTVNVGVKME